MHDMHTKSKARIQVLFLDCDICTSVGVSHTCTGKINNFAGTSCTSKSVKLLVKLVLSLKGIDEYYKVEYLTVQKFCTFIFFFF